MIASLEPGKKSNARRENCGRDGGSRTVRWLTVFLFRAYEVTQGACGLSSEAVCPLFARRVLLRELPPGASPEIVLAPGGQPHRRACRSQRNTLALYGEALLVRKARRIIVTGLR
jgi:hypothetical protein